MRFVNYNDFELLYLIQEGSEQALQILYQKYYVYVCKLASEYFPYGDKRNDLIQEGFMIIDKCIKTFQQEMTVSLFSYINISLHRKFGNLMRTSYYKPTIYLTEDVQFYEKTDRVKNDRYYYLKNPYYFCENDFDFLLYKECILQGLSLKAFSLKYNVEYHKVYGRRQNLLRELKKILTKL